MQIDISVAQQSTLIGLLLSVGLLACWVVRRRNKKKVIASEYEKSKYSGKQKVGVIIILLFILPISLRIIWPMVSAMFYVWLIPVNMLSQYPWLHLPLQTTVVTTSNTISFIGCYCLCEYFWPNRGKENGDTMFM